MRLFQAPLDTCLDSPFFADLSVPRFALHGLRALDIGFLNVVRNFEFLRSVCKPSRASHKFNVSQIQALQRQAGQFPVWTRDTSDGHEWGRAFLNNIFGPKSILVFVIVAYFLSFGQLPNTIKWWKAFNI